MRPLATPPRTPPPKASLTAPPAKPLTAPRGLVIEFKFAIPSILLKLSSPDFEVPDLDEN